MPESGSSSSGESENDSQQVERVQPLVEEGGAVCRVVIPGKLYAKPLFAQILNNFLLRSSLAKLHKPAKFIRLHYKHLYTLKCLKI